MAQFLSWSWHSNSTQLLTSLETKHSSSIKESKAEDGSLAKQHGCEQQRPYMNKIYKVHKYKLLGLCPGKNTRNRRGCIVRYQLFLILVMFSVQHQSSGSTSFNNHLLIGSSHSTLLCGSYFRACHFQHLLVWDPEDEPCSPRSRRASDSRLVLSMALCPTSLEKQVHPALLVRCWTLCSQRHYSDGLC